MLSRKIFKKLVVLIIALIVMAGIAVADDYDKVDKRIARLSDCDITAKNTVGTAGATASLSVTKSASCGATASYSTINPNTLETKTVTKQNGGQWGVRLYFEADSGWRSVKLVSTYSVTYAGQSWETKVTTIR